MKLFTALSFLIVTTFSTFTTGEKNDGTIAQEQQEVGSSNLRRNSDNRALTEGLSIPTESRIVGGSNAPDGAYPFFVSWSGCGASLVADDVILSAAHCRGQSTNEVTVGKYRTGYNSNGVTRQITERNSHPNYRGNSIDYDYMVMKLDRPVDTNIYPPIRINQDINVPANRQELTVIGFGSLSQGGSSTPSRLQEVDVNYIPSTTCNAGYSSYNGDVKDATMFCAGTGGGKDSCQGDSGGPIFTKGETIEQVGIVSWGRGCAQRRYPGVYSRISGEYDWIKAQVCGLANTPPAYCNDSNFPGTPNAPESGPTLTRNPTPAPTRNPTPAPTRAPMSDSQSDLVIFVCAILPFLCQ